MARQRFVCVRACFFLSKKRADLGLLASLAGLLSGIATSRHHSLRQQRKTMTLFCFSPPLLFIFRPVHRFIHLLRFFEVFFLWFDLSFPFLLVLSLFIHCFTFLSLILLPYYLANLFFPYPVLPFIPVLSFCIPHFPLIPCPVFPFTVFLSFL